MREIQYEIVKEIAVLSTGDSGYTKEINLISWNGKEPKYDIRSFSPNREKCGKGITRFLNTRMRNSLGKILFGLEWLENMRWYILIKPFTSEIILKMD